MKLVCEEYFRKIEDIDLKHKICASSEVKKEDSKVKSVQNVVNVVSVVGGIALNVLNKKR